MVFIKIVYSSEIRRFSVDPAITYKEFKAKVISLYKLAEDAKLRLNYLDHDGDSVFLSSDEELHEAFRVVCREKDDTICFVARKKGEASPAFINGDDDCPFGNCLRRQRRAMIPIYPPVPWIPVVPEGIRAQSLFSGWYPLGDSQLMVTKNTKTSGGCPFGTCPAMQQHHPKMMMFKEEEFVEGEKDEQSTSPSEGHKKHKKKH